MNERICKKHEQEKGDCLEKAFGNMIAHIPRMITHSKSYWIHDKTSGSRKVKYDAESVV